MTYDFIVIGGGIAGLSTAYYLSEKNYNTLLIEENYLGFGGSGAAGAFLNPKVDKSGKLAEIVNSAIKFSTDLYSEKFTNNIHKSKLNNILEDGKSLKLHGAVADANDILKSFSKNIDLEFFKVSDIEFLENHQIWRVENLFAKSIIIATGAFGTIFDEPYLNIRPVWGERLDILSSTILEESFHKNISVSQTINGKIRVGATHFREVLNRESLESEKAELLKEAENIVKLKDVKILTSISGVRSASRDYFPIVGKVVDSEKTIEKFPQIQNGRKYDYRQYIYYKNLYFFSGLGGYGFSLAPYLAKKLVANMETGEMFDRDLEPYRFFERWVKRSSKLCEV